ncbi:zinc ribbon domain-containing protein [Tepidiforma sp.]|uniref:zinc ribbon domain-containing protein n=1 Tax=Tepidiforma sp. TaxID=2682230 RepID=UPI002ADDD06D|nr:C4-type zinc ribbon domain-containing protein [Tepidiforma sp.]
MSQLTEIRTLQEIDDDIARLEASLAEVERRLADDAALQAARDAFAAADAAWQEVRRTQRDLELSIQGLTSRIAPEEKRLYDGSVRNPKELTSIQQEVEHLKAQRAALEDRLLEVMEQFEAASAAREAARADLERAEADRAAQCRGLEAEKAALEARIADARARRDAQAARIPPAALATYDGIRRRRGGLAVARIQGGTCGGCRVAIPESVRRRAFDAAQLAQCPNCERILYVG